MTETNTKPKYKITKQLTKALNDAIRDKPGICSTDLAAALSISESKLSGVARELTAKGQLVRKRIEKHFGYYLPEHVGDVPPVQLIIPSDIRPADIVELAELDAIREELESLRAEVKDLRAFKERAISQYPELDVDPILLEARKIAYLAFLDAGESDSADFARYGNADDTPMLKAIVGTLQRAAGAE